MLGTPNDNNSKKIYQPTVYSKYGYSNTESKLDPSRLSISMWGGLLKLSIQPMKSDSTSDNPSFDTENSGDIYLSHTKAQLFMNEIDNYINNPEDYFNRGVSTNKGLITINNGLDKLGKISPLLVINSIDEKGEIKSEYIYEFKTNYHYMIRNYDPKNKDNSFLKEYDKYIELIQLRNLIEDYYRGMSGGYAYANMEYGKFDSNRLNNKLDSICEKLGVDYKSNNSNQFRRTKSIFDTSPSSNKSSETSKSNFDGELGVDDLMDGFSDF